MEIEGRAAGKVDNKGSTVPIFIILVFYGIEEEKLIKLLEVRFYQFGNYILALKTKRKLIYSRDRQYIFMTITKGH